MGKAMRKVLVSTASAEYACVLDATRGQMEKYASRHGYDVDFSIRDIGKRCPYWLKVAAIMAQWETYDIVLWIDADIAVDHRAPDILDDLPEDKEVGAVVVHTYEGAVYNTGMMLMRNTPRMREMFLRVWDSHDEYCTNRWGDNACIMKLMGYTDSSPATYVGNGEYEAESYLLDPKWNTIVGSGADGYFMHVAGGSGRPENKAAALSRVIGGWS